MEGKMTHWILHYNVAHDLVREGILNGVEIRSEKRKNHEKVGVYYEGKFAEEGKDSDFYKHGDKVYEAGALEKFCQEQNSHPHDFEGNKLTNHADRFNRERDQLMIFKLEHDNVPDIIKENYQKYLVIRKKGDKK
jgi:hypothetical protein